jgi:hypothetical protein
MVRRNRSSFVRFLVASLLAIVAMSSGMVLRTAHAAGTPLELVTMLQDVSTADQHRYNAVDDQNVGLDTLKIIPNPQGGYLGVYHHLLNGAFQVRLATSTDVLTWHYVTTLQTVASQPTIASLSDGSFVVAFEKEAEGTYCGGAGSCLGFRHYASVEALLSGASDHFLVVNRTLSLCNEGTPNIYAATLQPDITHSIINVGFHYYSGCNVDRQAIGTLTNFASWKTQADANVNTLFTNLGTIHGNVGDRDSFFYRGQAYSLIEAQSIKSDYSTWRPYLFDRTLNTLTQLVLHTNGGSTSFGNPTYTQVRLPGGLIGFVSTEFIFSEGAAPGEGGELIYVRPYPSQPGPDTTPPTVSITQPTNGSRVSRGATITIKANASDDVGVEKVGFSVNGTLTCVSPFASYTCTWTVPSKARVTYTLTATAFDLAGNTASAAVKVTSR